MDHGGALGAVHHHQLQQPPGSIRAQQEVAGRVLADLVHDERVSYGVVDVLGEDAVAKC
jgi:hypothetical protein